MKRIIPAVALVAISVMAWIFFFEVPNLSPVWRRVVHVALFAPWSFSLLYFLKNTLHWKLTRLKQYALLIGIAACCELIQFWTPGHDPEWSGLAASLIGVVFGRELYSHLNHRDHGEHRGRDKGVSGSINSPSA